MIGNSRIAALVDTKARIVWWCFPRFDSDPVFCRLIAGDEEKGFCDVVLDGLSKANPIMCATPPRWRPCCRRRTAPQVRITDFAPRFRNFDRMLRPPQLMRIIEPVAGLPRITIRLRPPSIMASR